MICFCKGEKTMKVIKKMLGVCKDELHKEVCFNRILLYILLVSLGFCIAHIVAKEGSVQYLIKRIDNINTRVDALSENIDIYFNMQNLNNKGEIK